ncbi:MAG TPA: serine hydrolase [Candidatus Limnocylindria bacterium]|nr:serine hydrolase [Candidatus Limnocylindria bacterium]
MITPQAPIPQTSITPQTSQVQTTQQAQKPEVQQIIKEVQLRHLLQAAVDQNEAASVLTGVTVRDLKADRTIFGHEQDTKHFAASVNKIPVALLVLEDLRAGTLDLDQVVTWQASDVRGGFGLYDQPGAPMQAPLRDVLYDMLNRSGNTVVRATVNYLLGGPAAVNARFATKPGLPNTSLTVLGPTTFYLGDSTTHDSIWAMEKLMQRQDSYARFMKDAMVTNIFTDFGVRSQLPDSDYVILVNKIGLLDDPEGNNRHDTGIIYNKKTKRSYGYSFFTTSPFESPTATVRADQSLKDMGSPLLRFAGNPKRSGWKYNHQNSHFGRPEKRVRY